MRIRSAMDHVQTIAELLSAVLAQPPFELERTPESLIPVLTVPKDPQHGDHAFPCFVLAKELRLAPPQIAARLAEACAARVAASDLLAAAEAAGPYLNFRVDTAAQAGALIPAVLSGEFLARRSPTGRRVMIEYSQPNTHKAFHVGHTRNVSLGDSLVRLCEWAGHEVVAANYIGDEGAHIAKCLWYYRNHFDGAVPTENRGEFLGTLYTKATELLDFSLLTECPHPGVVAARVESIDPHPTHEGWMVVRVNDGTVEHTVVCGGCGYAIGDIVGYASVGSRIGGREVLATDKEGVESDGMIVSEKEISLSDDAEKIQVFDPDTVLGIEVAELRRRPGAVPDDRSVLDVMRERSDGVAEVLKALESGEPEVTSLWEETREWSLQDFDEIYRWLGARFDHVFYESEVGEEGKQIVQEYLARGVFVRSEGAVGARLDEFGLPFFLLLRSNGTGLYSTKDIALARRKFEEFQIDDSVYVVDVRQSLHFQQVFRTLELMGYENAKNCYHLAYGFVLLPEGEMSSRRGTVILFSQLEQRLVEKIRREFIDDKDWPEDEKRAAARAIAVGTIRYGMLHHDTVKNIVFDLDEWTNKTGNTGPYLMYAYTRTRSIEQELGSHGLLTDRDTIARDWSLLKQEAEKEVLTAIQEFPELALRAAREYQPKLLCIHLYELAKSYSRMYHDCPVKTAETPELRFTRLDLHLAAGKVLESGLALLGIRVLDRM
ncbi:MAG: arginine--tRNA ligase [Planctomycetes bacterium]|nr:arginine--tRNA ligase [Planctomycetota bacterium]